MMTEEEKKQELNRLAGEFGAEEMSLALREAIVAWNDEATGTDKLSDKILLGVEAAAARRANTGHKDLLSDDSTVRQKCLKQIIGRDLARTISKTDELKAIIE